MSETADTDTRQFPGMERLCEMTLQLVESETPRRENNQLLDFGLRRNDGMGLIVGIWGDFVSEQAYPTIWSHVQLRKSQMKYIPLSGNPPGG